MRHLLSPIPTTTIITTTMPSSTTTTTSSSNSSTSSAAPSTKLKKLPQITNPTSAVCRHSALATLDVLILILVLFSGTFLLTSSFSHILTSLSLLLPPMNYTALLHDSPVPYAVGFCLVFLTALLSIEICCGHRARRCAKPGCKGMKKAMEFDLQVQTEECLKLAVSRDMIDKLPWKGGSEANPDYECLRSELRKMAPPNGRAVLLFRAKCGCPVAKLEGWGAKRSRRNKKGLALKGA